MKHLSHDPFVEHEKLSKMILPDDKPWRVTKTKFVFKDCLDDYTTVEFRRYRRGVEIKLRTVTERQTSGYVSCDLCHRHPVLSKDKFEFVLKNLGEDAVQALIKVLKGEEL